MESKVNIKEVKVSGDAKVGTILYAVNFADDKKTMNDTIYVTIQEMMIWAETMWTNMKPRITIDTLEMNGKIYATIDEQEKLVANITMLPLQ